MKGLRPVRVHQGKLIWAGEHWVAAIRPEGATQPSASISLYHIRYSAAGEGNFAQVIIGGDAPFSAVCIDRPELAEYRRAEFLARTIARDPNAPTVTARFQREGDMRRDPAWIIETENRRIIVRWQIAEPPVIADGTFRAGTEHFTVLFFAREASIEINGRPVAGKAYLIDGWKRTIGGERSSCCIALAEMMLEESAQAP